MELSMEWPSMVISLESLEPLSPDNFDNDQIATDVDKLSRSELAGKLLDHFDGIQEEESDPFGWYTHEKAIPIFESLPSPPYKIDLKPPTPANVYLDSTTINAGDYEPEPAQQPPLYHSCSLFEPDAYNPLPSFYSSLSPSQHFDAAPAVVPLAQPSPPVANAASYTFGDVKDECEPAPSDGSKTEWLKRETLTPPDSPKEEEILKMLEDFEPELQNLVAASGDQFETFTAPPPTFEQQPTSCASPAAHSDDGGSSCSRATSPFDVSDDPEWTPPARQSARVTSRRSSSSKHSTAARSTSAAAAKRRSTKPYSKSGAEDRRERKKEQNKNAATRYRLKKKAEVEEVKLEEHQLEKYNAKLWKEVEELGREIRYLKSLMREVYRKKGLIK
ncbi:hypothetical protein V9T40_007811 [Parthenolecanium corni]|uniref:BZIP domain-containing protein n=1 Tax=Parthenolecanium corni TaxID=536013 RepID=A0AAN9TK09_9HEMI